MLRKLDSNSLTKTKNWSGRNEVTETSGRPHPLWPQNKWLYTPRTTDYRHTRRNRWIQTELASTLAKESHKTEPLWNHTATDRKEREQWVDRRSVGASSCNCGDGTDQRVQHLMFMMMMMIWHYDIYIRRATSMSVLQIFLQDILTFEDEDMAFYRNVGIRLPVDEVSYTTRTELWGTSSREPWFWYNYVLETIKSVPYNCSKWFVLLLHWICRALWIIRWNRKEQGVEMRSEEFARATLRSVTDMCQNVSTTKYFVAGSQTYKSSLISH